MQYDVIMCVTWKIYISLWLPCVMIIHGAASSRTSHLTVVIVTLVFLTLSADPWCRVEAPRQVILLFQVYCLFPPFFPPRYRPCLRMSFVKETYLN